MATGTHHPCPGPARAEPAHARWRPEGAGPSPPRRRKPCGGAMAALARAAVSVRPERAAVRQRQPRAAGPAPSGRACPAGCVRRGLSAENVREAQPGPRGCGGSGARRLLMPPCPWPPAPPQGPAAPARPCLRWASDASFIACLYIRSRPGFSIPAWGPVGWGLLLWEIPFSLQRCLVERIM